MKKQLLDLLCMPVLVMISAWFLGGAALIPTCYADENVVTVKMETSEGDIILALNHEKAPISVANFLNYVDDGFYEGTIFHRVIRNFMIQGGGFDENMKQKATKDPIKNESDNGLANDAFTIAMARTQNPDSATSQFYINLVDNPSLNKAGRNHGYAVFGKVEEGIDVVKKIGNVKTANAGFHQNVPIEPVIIYRIVRISDGSEQ
jgi:cyclophilin family peptidyl-prolyl cis-trans isomerase